MILDPLSIGVGLVVGVLVTLFVREIAFRHVLNDEHSKLTAHWSLAESGGHPVKLSAERLSAGVEVPPGSRVLVGRGSAVPPEVAKRCEVRVSDRIQSNFALADGRAIVFASAVRPQALGVWTYEDQVLQRLALEWDHAWQHAEPMVPRASVTSLKDLTGQTVEVVASVTDVAEKGGVQYLRLIENGFTATVANHEPIQAGKGSTVRVLGTVDRALSGKEPVLRAQKVEALRGATFG
jgi:hypothetical protein